MIVKVTKSFDVDVSGFNSHVVNMTDLSEAIARKKIKRGLDEQLITKETFTYEAHPELPSNYEIDSDFKTQELFDIVLMETEFENGLDVENLSKMTSYLKSSYVFPLDIQAEFSSAIGFITTEASEKLNYRHESIEAFIKPILGDMDNEILSGEYTTSDLRILMRRNF